MAAQSSTTAAVNNNVNFGGVQTATVVIKSGENNNSLSNSRSFKRKKINNIVNKTYYYAPKSCSSTNNSSKSIRHCSIVAESSLFPSTVVVTDNDTTKDFKNIFIGTKNLPSTTLVKEKENFKSYQSNSSSLNFENSNLKDKNDCCFFSTNNINLDESHTCKPSTSVAIELFEFPNTLIENTVKTSENKTSALVKAVPENNDIQQKKRLSKILRRQKNKTSISQLCLLQPQQKQSLSHQKQQNENSKQYSSSQIIEYNSVNSKTNCNEQIISTLPHCNSFDVKYYNPSKILLPSKTNFNNESHIQFQKQHVVSRSNSAYSFLTNGTVIFTESSLKTKKIMAGTSVSATNLINFNLHNTTNVPHISKKTMTQDNSNYNLKMCDTATKQYNIFTTPKFIEKEKSESGCWQRQHQHLQKLSQRERSMTCRGNSMDQCYTCGAPYSRSDQSYLRTLFQLQRNYQLSVGGDFADNLSPSGSQMIVLSHDRHYSFGSKLSDVSLNTNKRSSSPILLPNASETIASTVISAFKRRDTQRRQKSTYWSSFEKYTDYNYSNSLSREFSRSGSLYNSRKITDSDRHIRAISGVKKIILFMICFIICSNNTYIE